MMSVVFNNSVDVFTVDMFKGNKNDLFYKSPPKTLHQQEYIAPISIIRAKRVTFQAAMKLTIIIGQCFGLIPVLGVCDLDASKLRFSFCSGRCIYSILSVFGQSCIMCCCVLQLFTTTDASFSSSATLVFFGTNTATTFIFLRMAMKWPRFCRHISMTEVADPNLDSSLIRRCNVSCIIVLALALLEHILSDLSGLAIAIDCQPDKNLYEAFIIQGFSWIWTLVNYNAILGLIVQVLNLQCTFNWNFADIFVICVSWYLISRLEQINHRIIAVRGKIVPSSFWRIMREDYSRAANLVKKVDEVIGGIIFVSFANNLFFICLQLMHTLVTSAFFGRMLQAVFFRFREGVKVTSLCRNSNDRPLRGYEQAVYFVYSFGFLVARSTAVSLIAARVHTTSRLPAQALYDVPSSAYCVEVQRFLHQIQGDTVALSGLQFFNVKRGLVLSIAGTIVTYELVLMQVAGVSPTISPPTTL